MLLPDFLLQNYNLRINGMNFATRIISSAKIGCRCAGLWHRPVRTVETRRAASLPCTSLRLKPNTAPLAPVPNLLVPAQLLDFRKGGAGAVEHLLQDDVLDGVLGLRYV